MVNDGVMAGAMQGAQAALGSAGFRNTLFTMFGGDPRQQGPATNNTGSNNV